MSVISSSAPGRCSIVGNPSDGYGGTVLSCSIQLRAQVEVHPCDCLRVAAPTRQMELRTEADFELHGDEFDIPKTVLKHLELAGARLELRLSSSIPYRAALAGSSAMYAAVFGALAAFKGVSFGSYETAEHLHFMESCLLRMRCGYQDHYMTVFGGLNCIDFRGKEHSKPLKEEIYATVEPLGPYVNELPFIVANTGVQRVSGAILKPVRERWEAGESLVVEGYTRAAELGRLGKKALLAEKWSELGRLMNENHAIQQRIGASGEANDRLIAAALNAGAEGAKLAGAGGGGTIIALATDPEPVVGALRSAGATLILSLGIHPGLQIDITG